MPPILGQVTVSARTVHCQPGEPLSAPARMIFDRAVQAPLVFRRRPKHSIAAEGGAMADFDMTWAKMDPDHVPPEIDTTRPSVARVYDAILGGKDNFAVD